MHMMIVGLRLISIHTYLQLFDVQVWHTGPVVDHIIHDWLSERGVVLIMTPAHKSNNMMDTEVTS